MQESDFSNVQEQNEALTAQSASGSSDHMKQVSVRQTVSQTGQPLKGQVIYQNHIRKQPSKGQDSCQPNGSQGPGGLSSFSSMHIQDADPRARNRADKNRFDSCKTEAEMEETNRSEINRAEKNGETAEASRTQLKSQGIRKDSPCAPGNSSPGEAFPGGPRCGEFHPHGLRPGEQAFRAATPYPPVKAGCQNPRYASAMLDNLGGQFSEMTAVGQYFYSSLLSAECPEISETFHQVNIVEMHHLKIFGQLAMQLGADPRLWTRSLRTGRYMYWDAGYLHYSSSIKELLSAAIASEREACSKYLKQASWIQDPNICDNLKRIAADEQMHAELFTRLFHKYC